MDPPRSSHSSSPAGSQASTQSRPRPPIKLRRFIKIERGILAYRPTFRPPPALPEKPAEADHVMACLALAHTRGERVGLREICAASGVASGVGSAVRRWAKSCGLWPYADRLGGFQARIEARRNRAHARKGGAP